MYQRAGGSGGGDDWYNVILLTATNGVTVTITDGDEEIEIVGTGSQQAVPIHDENATYTISASENGLPKSAQNVVTTTTSGVIFTRELKMAKVTLTYVADFQGQTYTISDGTTTSTTQTFPSAGDTVDFYVPNTGSWVVTGTDGTNYYESDPIVVTDLDDTYTGKIETRPDGKTEPPNDIQTWLKCAGLKDLPYTTLDEVLEDHETLQILMTEHNAVDYMVRSKTWIKQISVPTLSADVPEATASSFRNSTYAKYKAFDGNATSDGWCPDPADTNQSWIQYEFDSPIQVTEVYTRGGVTSGATHTYTATILGSKDGFVSDTHELGTVEIKGGPSNIQKYTEINNTETYKYYRVRLETTTSGDYCNGNGMKFNFLTDHGITEDETAMRYIGKRNYAADECLDDSDWCEAICESEYWDSVLNKKVPKMTSNTTPSGVASCSEKLNNNYDAWVAFDDGTSTTNGWYVVNMPSGNWVEYDFGTPVCVKKFKGKIIDSSGYSLTVKIEGYNGSSYDELKTNVSIGSQYNEYTLYDNKTAYSKYRLTIISASISGGCGGLKLNYYGRVDVDETKVTIYGAKNDTIYYKDGGSDQTLVTFQDDVKAEVSKSAFPTGEVTLYSSVSKDPDNLTDDFKRTFVNNANLIEAWVAPVDDPLYWYGYDCGDLEDCTAANGYSTSSGYSIETPTHNTRDIYIATSANYKFSGIATKTRKCDAFKTIAKGAPSTNPAWSKNMMGISSTPKTGVPQSLFDLGSAGIQDNNDEQIRSVALKGSGKGYMSVSNMNARSSYLYGMWPIKPNPLANFFSAAKDTVYYLDNGIQVVVAETDEFGGAKVDFSQIPIGVTLYSSVADDPDSLATTPAPFSKVFNGPNSSGKFYLMPEDSEKILYWYGYMGSNCEVMNTGNGWIWSGMVFDNPTLNTNYCNLSTANGHLSGFGTKNAVNVTKSYLIGKGITYQSSQAGFLRTASAKNDSSVEAAEIITSSSLQKITNTVSGTKIVCAYTQGSSLGTRSCDIYALWYE